MKLISIILLPDVEAKEPETSLNQTINSLMNQNYPYWELIVINGQKKSGVLSDLITNDKIKYLQGNFKNRSSALNVAFEKVTGDYIILVNTVEGEVTFRLSTLELFLMVAERHPNIGMIYSDYQMIDRNGFAKDIHLLNHHWGRVRDNMDYGALTMYSKQALRDVGISNDNYNAADLYDLRLRIASKFKIVHIEAKMNGYGYVVKSTPKAQNVFDYLMAGKDVQLEMEQALTGHLKRIGAYMNSKMPYEKIDYTPEEDSEFQTCIASVVIPVYDRENFIGTAIESVQAQTIQNIEVIVVVNGGIGDATIRGVKKYMPGGEKYAPEKPEVRLLVEDVNNIGFCLNKGIREARGKYYIQLDSDDRLKPDAIEKIIRVFDSDAGIAMVIGSYEVWQKHDDTGKITRMEEIPVVTHDEWTEDNGRNNLLRINGAGAPRAAHIKAIQALGGFGMNDSEYCRNYGEDYDLVLRISERYRIGRVWEPIYDVIRHSGGTDHSIDQLTIDRNDNAKDLMRKEAIERRIAINMSGK